MTCPSSPVHMSQMGMTNKNIDPEFTQLKKKTAESLLFSGLLYLTPGKYRRNEAVSVVYGLFFEHVS